MVCVGNICRSPVAEHLMQAKLPHLDVSSAGLSAVVGSDIDETMREVAEAAGHVLPAHRARQFSSAMGETAGLILVMEAGHRGDIIARAPHLSGRVMLLSHWDGGRDISDPYRRPRGHHEAALKSIEAGVNEWSRRLHSI